MKGLKLLFVGLIVSALFMGQAMAGVSALQWAWNDSLTAVQTSINVAPGQTAMVNFSASLTATCSGGPCGAAMVNVNDQLDFLNSSAMFTGGSGSQNFPFNWGGTVGPFSTSGMITNQAFAVDGINVPSNTVEIPVNVSTVPEPSTFLLLGAGLAGVGLMRRKFRK